MELIIGSKNWSSWSLRPWLAIRRTGASFSERLIPLRRQEATAEIAQFSPSGWVPVLKAGDLTVWDSLAICEYLADRYPEAGLWPADAEARALGRAASAEMHSGFASLRGECPMELSLRTQADLSEATGDNIRRIVRLWSDLRARYQDAGAFLLGQWSIADAFFTPVATRFRSYGVKLSDFGDQGAAGQYAEALLEQPDFLEWETAALAEG